MMGLNLERQLGSINFPWILGMPDTLEYIFFIFY